MPVTPHPQRYTTPEPATSPLEHPLLTSSPADINIFRAANNYLKDSISSNQSLSIEECDHIARLARSFEKFYTRNNLSEKEISDLRALLQARKNRLAGRRGLLKDKHCVTKSGLYAELAQAKRAALEKKEKAKAGKKGRGRPRKSDSNPSSAPPLDSAIDPSLVHPDTEVLSSDEEE
jgi:hypothetical protein